MFTSTPFHPREDDSEAGAIPGNVLGSNVPVRQSISRGRKSYAFPLQQVFEETRSMLAFDGSRSYLQEPSEFEATLVRNRRTTFGASGMTYGDYIEALQQLHAQFGVTIDSMTDRSQIFEVIDAWINDIEMAGEYPKSNQSDISDSDFRKLQSFLSRESEMWRLIHSLYFNRLNEDGSENIPFTGEIKDKYCINEGPYVDEICGNDPVLVEMFTILGWLEANFTRNGPPDLNPKTFIWENTLSALNRDKQLNKPTSKAMVTHIDPDAPHREGKHLHPLDDEENNKVLRGAFYYIRIGQTENAITYLKESGDRMKAAALSGYRYTSKIHKVQGTGAAPRENVLTSMEYLPSSNRQARPNPDFDIQGNPKRDGWKQVTWKVCEQNKMSKYDQALMGAVVGHRQSMLNVAQSWEDRLWAFIKASVDVTIEGALRNASNPNNRKPLPDGYWAQKLSVAECIQKVDAFGRADTKNSSEYLFQILQKCIMVDKLEVFLDDLEGNIQDLVGLYEHPLLKGHVIRFLTHLILFFGIVNLPFSQDMFDICLENYISVLVDINMFTRIPYYVQKLSDEKRLPIIVHHVGPSHSIDKIDIVEFLTNAQKNDLDVLSIAVAIVDKMKDEESDFKVENLEWINECYGILDNSPLVLLELLKYTIWISRKYLTLRNIGKVQQLIGQLPPDGVREVSQISEELENTLIREYICYKVYLEAEDALAFWKRTLGQKPQMENYVLPVNATSADRAMFEKKKAEHETLVTKWTRAVDYHLNQAIEKFMDILKFPSGWLRDCYDPSDEDEALHVGAVRRIVMKQVVHVLLRLVQDKGDNRTMRDFIAVLCDEKRNILKELSREEIGNIFKVAEKFTRSKVSNIMFLPK